MDKIKRFTALIISFLVSLLLSPLLAVAIVSLCLIVRGVLVSAYLRLRYGTKIKLVGSMDSFQVHDKENNLLETFTLLVLEGRADIGNIRKRVWTSVLSREDKTYEKLWCRVVTKCGFYCWDNVGEEFDLKNHVKLAKTGNGGDNNNANNKEVAWRETAVLDKIGQFYSQGMSLDVPRWEIVVFPHFLYDEDISPPVDRYAVLFRVHHSIMDGISMSLLISRVLSDDHHHTLYDKLDPLAQPPRTITSVGKIAWGYVRLFYSWPYFMYEALSAPPEANPFHGPDLSKDKILTWSRPFSLDRLRTIRSSFSVGTNSILNAAVAGAFKRLSEIKGSSVPEQVTFVTSIPILPYPNLKPQNRFSGAFFSQPISSSMSSSERVQRTHETLSVILNSPLILMNSLLLRFIGTLPARLSKNMTDSRELTCLTSNVPGAPEPAFLFGGHRVVDVAGFLPIKNKTGFGVCFVSYCGRLRAGIVADAAVASREDVELLKEGILAEIDEIEEEITSEISSIGSDDKCNNLNLV